MSKYLNIVDKHPIKEFTSFCTDSGIVLCEKQSGSFLCLNHTQDLINLQEHLKLLSIK